MRLLNKGVLGAAVIAGCSACTDTIDEHYAVSDGVAKQTLWEQIQAQPDLTKFAKILETVHYYDTETKASSLTYKDILQMNNKLTVWAPVDGSVDLDALLEEAKTDEYNVDHRFIRNHVNTFVRNVLGTEKDSITMLNTKMNVLDNAEKTFKGVAIAQSNIPASNGILHKLDHEVPFLNNLYEFMQTTPEVSSLYQYFHDRDTTYLDENQSVQGGIVDGEITWADSVMRTESKAFNYQYQYRGETWDGISANLKDEDSTYVMIMPTNVGWEKAVAKTKPYYNYMSYPYANKEDKNSQAETVNPDTMQNRQVMMSIVNRLVFSPNRQKDYTLEDFGHTDSLFTTRGEVVDTPVCNQIFQGITPVELSNGYAYLSDDYKFNVASDIEIEGENTYYRHDDAKNASTEIKTGTIVNSSRNPNVTGSVSGGGYAYTIPMSTKNPTNIAYRLPNVLSAKYDIYAVILPENIQRPGVSALPLKFRATLNYYDGTKPGESSKPVTNLTNDTSKVDTILLFEDFQFPVAYKGVSGAYPILTLQVENAQGLGVKFSNSIYLDKIILKAKEEE